MKFGRPLGLAIIVIVYYTYNSIWSCKSCVPDMGPNNILNFKVER